MALLVRSSPYRIMVGRVIFVSERPKVDPAAIVQNGPFLPFRHGRCKSVAPRDFALLHKTSIIMADADIYPGNTEAPWGVGLSRGANKKQ